MAFLKGDMSVVGPRPLAEQYLPYYSEREKLRHTVTPGLTGLAQIKGRNAVSWEERFHYDVQYVENLTFRGDVMIILETVATVFKHENIGVRGVDAPLDFDVYRKKQKEEGNVY